MCEHTLVAAYTEYKGPDGAMVATALPILTMAPRRRCFIPGSTNRVICAKQSRDYSRPTSSVVAEGEIKTGHTSS